MIWCLGMEFLVKGVCRRGRWVGGGVISFVPPALSGMGWLHAENERAHARDAEKNVSLHFPSRCSKIVLRACMCVCTLV